MTQIKGRIGCLTKSLVTFLNTREEERSKKYGRNMAKYYERVIKSIDASFDDHRYALNNLPLDYIKKINFRQKYDFMLRNLLEHKFEKEAPVDVIEQALDSIGIIGKSVYFDEEINTLASKDFDKVIAWLAYLKKKQVTKST